MASEEERAAILAEYKASVASANNDDDEDDFEDDEADFDPDSDEEEVEGSEEEEAATEDDYVVLAGSIHLNEEGRIIYSGTWCMKSEFDDGNKQTLMNSSLSFLKEHRKKNYPKFKLKSQTVCYPPGGGGGSDNKKLFDICQPTLTENGEVSSRRIVLFDGFFCEKTPLPAAADDSIPQDTNNGEKSSSNSPKKIKERDVEVFISVVESEKETNGGVSLDAFGNPTFSSAEESSKPKYRIAGRGQNEYGQFVLDGSYLPPAEFDKHSKATVICNKRYGVGGETKETRATSRGSKRKTRGDDDSFDEDFDSEERADYTELIELSEDANLSVEELRKKYYGGGTDDQEEEEVDEDDDGGGKMSPAKQPRLDEESDDEECGF